MTTGAERSRVCVTGGAGFIGRHLCRALLDDGYEVVCLDRALATGISSPGALPSGVEPVAADVCVDALEPLFADVDAVIHLAALPGVRTRHRSHELWRQNVHATARVVRALGDRSRLVLASTSSVYGNASRLPSPEESPPVPLNDYAATKLAAERSVLAAARRGADALVCRLFTVFGPGQRPDMAFSRWISSLVAGRPVPWCAHPGARREFTYVGDAVRALVAALEGGRAGEVYNVAGSGSTPVRVALAEIEHLLGRRATLSPRPANREAVATAACGFKASAELGYEPRVSLRRGLERQLEDALPVAGTGAGALA